MGERRQAVGYLTRVDLITLILKMIRGEIQKIDSQKVFVRKIGNPTAKNKLVILHGWNQNGSFSWEKFMNLFDENTYILAPDLPGFGKSDPPKQVWSANEYALFLKKFIEKNGAENFRLIGHSFGGAICAVFTSFEAKKIKEMFLCAPAIVRKNPSKKQRILKKTSEKMNFLKKIPGFRKILYKILGSTDYEKTTGIMQEIFKKVVATDLQKILPKIKVKTTIVWGDKDKYTPLYQAEIIKNGIKNSKLIIFENTNHGIHLHTPEKLQKLVTK